MWIVINIFTNIFIETIVFLIGLYILATVILEGIIKRILWRYYNRPIYIYSKPSINRPSINRHPCLSAIKFENRKCPGVNNRHPRFYRHRHSLRAKIGKLPRLTAIFSAKGSKFQTFLYFVQKIVFKYKKFGNLQDLESISCWYQKNNHATHIQRATFYDISKFKRFRKCDDKTLPRPTATLGYPPHLTRDGWGRLIEGLLYIYTN